MPSRCGAHPLQLIWQRWFVVTRHRYGLDDLGSPGVGALGCEARRHLLPSPLLLPLLLLQKPPVVVVRRVELEVRPLLELRLQRLRFCLRLRLCALRALRAGDVHAHHAVRRRFHVVPAAIPCTAALAVSEEELDFLDRATRRERVRDSTLFCSVLFCSSPSLSPSRSLSPSLPLCLSLSLSLSLVTVVDQERSLEVPNT